MALFSHILILALAVSSVSPLRTAASGDVVVENDAATLVLSGDGYAKSLKSKATGQECLAGKEKLPFCTLTQNHPYDNENLLTLPSKPTTFPANKLYARSDTLFVEFAGTRDIALVKVGVAPGYFTFTLVGRDYHIEKMGIKRKTEVDELCFCQLPVRDRKNFGAWMNVAWDDKTAVCLMGSMPETYIDCKSSKGVRGMSATAWNSVLLPGPGAVLVCEATPRFLDTVDAVEKDLGLPSGVEDRRREGVGMSYYEDRGVTPATVDESIAWAKRGGFGIYTIYYAAFSHGPGRGEYGCGTYGWNADYPRGMEDLKEVAGKVHAAGMKMGYHIHYNKCSLDDAYVRNADPRVGAAAHLILAGDVSPEDTEIVVHTLPRGIREEPLRRLLLLDKEYIYFDSYTTEPPYKFTGCKRASLGSKAVSHTAGTRFIHVDVDSWTDFIRMDFSSDVQEEIASRINDVCRECGVDFLYYDGSDDVQEPYWYSIAKSQMRIHDALERKPLYSEGSMKPHFSWHLYARGNAFDAFRPEMIRASLEKYVVPCAKLNAMDFTPVNFGWTTNLPPSARSMGMQPDMFGIICARAAGYGCPMSLRGEAEQMRKNPMTGENLDVIRAWEELRLSGTLTEKQKEMLRDPSKEFVLLDGRIFECKELSPEGYKGVRAFSFRRDGKSCIIFWVPRGSVLFDMDFGGAPVSLTFADGSSSGLVNGKFKAVPRRQILETEMKMEKMEEIFIKRLYQK